MDEILAKRREIFFNNLILLGLDKMLFEKKYGITFHKDMFLLPNKKGYEIVTYFLFSKLSSATGKDYNIQWPLLCKEHDRVFQKTCYSHLMNFSKENCVKFPRIVPSLLLTFGGDRFYNVYLAFSSYVLYKAIKKNVKVHSLPMPSVSQENFRTSKEILQLSTILNIKKFRDTEMISYCTLNIWSKFAKILEESLSKSKQFLKAIDEVIRGKKITILALYPTISDRSFNLSKVVEKCFDCLKPVLKQRRILDEFLSSEQKYWQYLCSEVGENAESEFLNGQDYRIQVNEYLPEKYAKELKDAGCLSSDDNGKLSIERFIKIFMAYLAFMVELLKKANLNDLNRACYVENAASIEDDLKCIKNLNKKLSDEVIPDVEKNIEKFKIVCSYNDINENLEISDEQFFALPMPSFDVEAVEQRTSHFDASLEKIFRLSSEKPPHDKNKNNATVPERNLIECSFTSLTDQNFTSSLSSFSSSILSKNGMFVNSNKKEEKSLNYFSANMVTPTDPFASLNVNKSSFSDLDISPSTQFQMSQSWLEEESLNTMTLPDISFDD